MYEEFELKVGSILWIEMLQIHELRGMEESKAQAAEITGINNPCKKGKWRQL